MADGEAASAARFQACIPPPVANLRQVGAVMLGEAKGGDKISAHACLPIRCTCLPPRTGGHRREWPEPRVGMRG